MAELPQYNGGATPFRQVSSSGYQAQAQMLGSLADKLDNWQSNIVRVGAEIRAEEGRKQAINDITSGNPAKIEKGYGYYAKAYNEISKASYNANIENDLRVRAEEFASQSTRDPEKFNAMYEAYTRSAVKNIQEPEFQALYQQTAQKLGGVYSANLIKEKFKAQRDNDIKAIDANIKDLETSYESAFANDDFETTTDSLSRITALMEAKVQAGEMSASMIPLEIKRILNNGVSTKVMTELDNSIQAGESDYVNRFMQSDTYKSMPIAERTALSKKMFEHIDNTFKATTEAFDANVQLADKMSKKTAMDLSADILQGKEVSNSKLDELLREKKIQPAQYKEILSLRADLSAGALTDNESAVMEYQIALEYVNPRTIASDSRLTVKTKQELIGRAVSIQRQEKADKRTADALAGYKKTMGISPIQYGVDYAKGNLDIEDSTEKQKTVLKLKTTVLKKVESGEIDVTQFPDAMADEVEKFKKRNKDNSDSRKYDIELGDYNEKLKMYNTSTNSTFGKIKSTVGMTSEPPKPPVKPSNYIPKNQRVTQ